METPHGKKTKPLTDTEIKAAKPKDADYQLYDGDGLTLLIKSSGSKLWQFRYYRPLTKQRTKQSFGAYPAVSLSDARKLRAESRVLLAKDWTDPTTVDKFCPHDEACSKASGLTPPR